MAKSREKAPDAPLTRRQQLFVERLSQDPRRNSAEAAREAGYTCKNPDDYKKVGWALMNLPENAHVQAAYKKLSEERWKKATSVTDEQVMEMLTAQAFASRERIARPGPDGRLECTPFEELWPEERWLVDYYRVITLNDGSGDTVLQPVLVPRQKAVELLAKAKGLFVERIKHEGGLSLEAERESLRQALAELADFGYPGEFTGPEGGCSVDEAPITGQKLDPV